MTRRTLLQASLMGSVAQIVHAQTTTPSQPEPEPAPEFVCPMDPDVRSATPGKCPRCGMQMEARILEPVAYPMELTAKPPSIPAGKPVDLAFRITDPANRQTVKRFETVHEKLFHFFAVSQDLEWFLHDHPVLGADGVFHLPVTLPTAGLYETFSDLYPAGGTPQWIPRFLYSRFIYSRFIYNKDAQPRPATSAVTRTYASPQRDGDVSVSLQVDPVEAYAGRKTNLFFEVTPGDGLELWLGASAHALWVSHDLLDAEHTHPVYFGKMQFQVFFPRPGAYRFWIQFQRKGTLHTLKFDIPVSG